TQPVTKTRDVQLLDIDCPTPNMCIAVGERASGGLYSVRLLNRVWTEVTVPTVYDLTHRDDGSSGALTSVSCLSPIDCSAVADLGGGDGGQPHTTPLLHYDGAGWSPPKQFLPIVGLLTTVRCVRGYFCLAGGYGWLRFQDGLWAAAGAPKGTHMP